MGLQGASGSVAVPPLVLPRVMLSPAHTIRSGRSGSVQCDDAQLVKWASSMAIVSALYYAVDPVPAPRGRARAANIATEFKSVRESTMVYFVRVLRALAV